MSLGELPMILFTVLSQMSVGAFIVLGLVQTIGGMKYSTKAIDRLADPALFAIGPALILGLIGSIFHMNDVFNVFNVFRHFGTSWLSREIVFGVGFAALGFLFFIMQALKLGSPMLRRVLAVVTALVGIGLVICQAQIYYSLPTVPAWNSGATWVQFFATTLLLGSLLVAMAFVLVVHRRRNRTARMTDEQLAFAETADEHRGTTMERFRAFFNDRHVPNAETRAQSEELLGASIRGLILLAIVVAGVLLITMPLYVSSLAGMGETGLASAAHYSTAFAFGRFALLVVGTFLLGLLAFYYAGFGVKKLAALSAILVTAFILTLIGEFMGRALFYEVMTRVGV